MVKKLVSICALLLLSGCATQRFHSKPLEPAAIADTYEARTLNDPALQQFIEANLNRKLPAWPPETWDLSTLTLAGFYYSPELNVARAKWGTARARVTTAAQRPNPALQLPFQYNANPRNGASPWTFGFGLAIPIETAGKRGYRTDQATHMSDAARFNIGNAAWQLRSRLRTQLLNLHTATRRADLFRQQIEAQRQIVAMLEKRLAVGAAAASEVNQQRILLIQHAADLANADKQARGARAQAATIIGVPVRELENVRIAVDDFERIYPDIPAQDAQRSALLNRSDLLGALSQYEASQAALRLQIANQYPDINLGPGYSWDAGANKIAFGVSGISLPLLNQNQGPIAEATASRAEAEANVKALQVQAINETARALVNYQASLRSLQQSEDLLAAQQRQLSALQKSFRSGETDRLALTLARQATYASLLVRQDVLAQVQQALGQLEDAMQRPLSATSIPAIPLKEHQYAD